MTIGRPITDNRERLPAWVIMPDTHEQDASRSDPRRDADREKKAERLLLAGLDHYLAGQYEQAVNVWTRVLFLDRRHARAHAYIERARSALAERQRASEELLDNGVAALQRGETAAARRLITSAVNQGGPSDDALVVLERLDRLEGAGGWVPAVGDRLRRRLRARTQPPPPAIARRVPWLPIALGAVLTVAAVVTAATWDQIRPLLVPPEVPVVAISFPTDESIPVPRGAELALTRAHSLFQRGRLREALDLLQRLPAGDPLQPSADALRGTIQDTLLTGADPGVALDPPPVIAAPNDPLP